MNKLILIILFLLINFFIFSPNNLLAAEDPGVDGGVGGSGLSTNIREKLTSAAGFDEVFQDNIGTYINRILKVVLGVGAIATLVMIMWGGVEWVTSGGDKNKYESARNRITAGIVGLALVAAGWGIWLLVLKFFNLDETELLDVESYIPAVGSQITTIASVKISEVVKFIQG